MDEACNGMLSSNFRAQNVIAAGVRVQRKCCFLPSTFSRSTAASTHDLLCTLALPTILIGVERRATFSSRENGHVSILRSLPPSRASQLFLATITPHPLAK